MKASFTVALCLGAMVVFQPLLNRMILEHKGLGFAAVLNGFIVFVLALLLWIALSFGFISPPSLLKLKPEGPFYWWYILPGIFGFMLVITTPIMIKHLGAFTTVLAMISGQIITSLVLDAMTQGIAITMPRLLGLALAIAGAYLSFKNR